ncbi:A/G-specific adenine glycosylase [Pseudalkalibacillus salsuginis]|uniref:A/G-specific adenine glycosylase n=1 Tax=Pseudalkalibacillus salsuginis TaxID=2910972 RepID=UPI001F3F19E1|nr:A/G-specific adenine glycosylase [Pseudalkalibacillus salsuginis]MCF6411994.1 A/G-specific adenine glycosylase [Pseudalkalibacillus salsuginis]
MPIKSNDDFEITLDIDAFQTDLLSWYEADHRDLPWRRDQDPYKIWVSEIMLQQTRVDTVIPYFKRFMELFPTVTALANADEEKVLKAWEGLGYYSRARNLQAAVREVEEKYQGIVPDRPKEIQALKGVGPYTAGAIASIAFGLPEPAVDGNVMRVLSRILLIDEDIAKPQTRKVFEEAVRILISKENPSHFNQGLMELGATICTPKNPSCMLCPVQSYCKAFDEGLQAELPVKKKKLKNKTLKIAVALLENQQGETIIEKRPEKGLLANLWQFPNHETVDGNTFPQKEQLKVHLEEKYPIQADLNDRVLEFQHIFSHLTWKITVYSGKFTANESLDEGMLVSKEQLELYPLPVPHQKIAALWKGE